MLVLFKSIGCFHFLMAAPESTRGCVLLMLHAVLCSGLAVLSCGWVELCRNPPTLIKRRKVSSLLNAMVGYLCV